MKIFDALFSFFVCLFFLAKLMPPPVPPARSPTTELTSKCQHTQVSPWPPGTQDSGIMDNIISFIDKYCIYRKCRTFLITRLQS